MGWLRPILDHFTVHAYNFKFEFFRKGGGLSDCNTDFINGMTIIKFVHVGVQFEKGAKYYETIKFSE